MPWDDARCEHGSVKILPVIGGFVLAAWVAGCSQGPRRQVDDGGVSGLGGATVGTSTANASSDGGAPTSSVASSSTGGAAEDGAEPGPKYDVDEPEDQCNAAEILCLGPNVYGCGDDERWELIETCEQGGLPRSDPKQGPTGEVCDPASGTCVPHEIVGTPEPTGTYYQFAFFDQDNSDFRGGADVDTYGNRIYVVQWDDPSTPGAGVNIDTYEVELLDSDADGELEPNQHPDNPDHPGPIEERVLTYIESFPMPESGSPGNTELFALEDRLYLVAGEVVEWVFGEATTTVVASRPPGASLIGYDERNDTWYAASEMPRRVAQWDKYTDEWGIAFYYPSMAGDHMDGLEVVTDPNTEITYVYVSDMTSDFLGQYRWDPALGWVQENVFQYDGTVGEFVEGMGFGAYHHFWAAGGGGAGPYGPLYEIGGGDLQDYLGEPEG
jgi:hypothetical protein